MFVILRITRTYIFVFLLHSCSIHKSLVLIISSGWGLIIRGMVSVTWIYV